MAAVDVTVMAAGSAMPPTPTTAAGTPAFAGKTDATGLEPVPGPSVAPGGGISTAHVLSLIHTPVLDEKAAASMMREVLQAWTDHVNPGFLKYRKSVAEGRDAAAIEWRDGEPGGATVLDATGKEYLDCLGGFGIYNVGHGHPVVKAAVAAQMDKQSLHSQELIDPLRAYCASLLAARLPGDLQYAFFTNSGTESVEACLKFAMLATGRKHFIGVIGAFHGKTLGSLGGTSKAVFRKPFSNALLPFTHLPVNDVEALRQAFAASRFTGNEIAGVLLEPVLGEGGIHVLSDEFLRAARALCDEYGAALIFDEVQSGMGRTGKMWACEWAGVAPDLMAIGKAFGGGVQAAGAAVGTARMWEKYLDNPFLFTTTFGGSPVAMAAAIATMHVLESEDLIAGAHAKGEWLLAQLRRLAAAHPRLLKAARGRGLMLGVEFHSDEIGYAFARGVFSRGVLLAGTLVNSRVLRVEPPLTITQAQLEVVVARFADTLVAMEAEGLAAPAPAAAAPTAPAAGGAGAPSAGKPAVRLVEAPVPAAALIATRPAAAAAAAAAAAPGTAPAAGSPDGSEHSELEHADPHHLVPRRRGGGHDRTVSECEGGEGEGDAGTEVSSVSESSVESDVEGDEEGAGQGAAPEVA